MRWTLLALLGAALTALGVVGLSLELVHRSDIWRTHNSGIALLVPGVYFSWKGLSERASGGGSDRPIWPGVVLCGVLTGIAVALYTVAPPFAILFAIVVLPIGWGASWASGWLGKD